MPEIVVNATGCGGRGISCIIYFVCYARYGIGFRVVKYLNNYVLLNNTWYLNYELLDHSS